LIVDRLSVRVNDPLGVHYQSIEAMKDDLFFCYALTKHALWEAASEGHEKDVDLVNQPLAFPS